MKRTRMSVKKFEEWAVLEEELRKGEQVAISRGLEPLKPSQLAVIFCVAKFEEHEWRKEFRMENEPKLELWVKAGLNPGSATTYLRVFQADLGHRDIAGMAEKELDLKKALDWSSRFKTDTPEELWQLAKEAFTPYHKEIGEEIREKVRKRQKEWVQKYKSLKGIESHEEHKPYTTRRDIRDAVKSVRELMKSQKWDIQKATTAVSQKTGVPADKIKKYL